MNEDIERQAARVVEDLAGKRNHDAADLYGEVCPACGVEIERGDIEWAGYWWEHWNPRAGAVNPHPFDPTDIGEDIS